MTYPQQTPDLLKHYRESTKYRSIIDKVAAGSGIDPAIIWGIGSRETGWGTSSLLKPSGPTGTGDWSKRPNNRYAGEDGLPADKLGWGRGLMQIDYAWHEFARSGNWRDAEANIRYGIQTVFAGKLMYLKKLYPGLSDDALTKAAISAYNCGEGIVAKAIRDGFDTDKFTAHGNYAGDVIARGNWWRDGGGWSR